MKTITMLAAVAAGLLACATAGFAADAAAPPSTVPAADFFNFPDMSEPVISPDGDALAILVRNKDGRRQLAILETADVRKAIVAASFRDVDIVDVHWTDDKRLVFGIWREDSSAEDQRGSGLYAVDRDGSNLRTIITPSWYELPTTTGTSIASRALRPNHSFERTLTDGSGDVIVLSWSFGEAVGAGGRWHAESTGTIPLRVDTRTGRVSDVLTGRKPGEVFDWLFDGRGKALAAMSSKDGEDALLVPDAAGGWSERARFPSIGSPAQAYTLHSVGPDGTAYAGRDTSDAAGARALYKLDLQTGKLDDAPLVSLKGFDFRGRLITDERKHKVLGVHYVADAGGTAWFDPEMKALQAKVDARIPGMVNDIDPAACGCAARVLVTSHSDRQPPLFFLYDRSDDTLIHVGSARPRISAAQMADTDFYRIKSRDGHELPVYVTKPHGKGPWPTVVLVHGGPQVRGWEWEWDDESQFLASRGYLVVKPEFRGSAGYGHALLLSGFRQWGLASQDDIADATIWAAAQGLADPKRTCIAGASYGGYATLMGLVRYGDLYQCGIAWAAVTDIDLMYDIWWSDSSDEWKGYGMPLMVGDRVKDAAQFVATSPLKQAARIKRPLLLAHGGVDRRVPIEHAKQLRSALEAAHAPLTWVFYPDEAHGWYRPETRVDFYKKVEAFLAANIGQPAPAGAAASPAAR